jgi:putative adenylate-forming enzyme
VAAKQLQRAQEAASFAAERSFGAAWDIWMSRWMSPGDVIHKSAQRLRSLIQFARSEAPLYQRLYRGLPHGTALRDLPVVTKAMLMADLPASLTVRDLTHEEIEGFLHSASVGSLLRDRYAVWTSSGTTGTPGIFLHDRDALVIYDALEMFRFRGATAPAELAVRLMAGERFAMVAATGGHFAGASMVERLRLHYPWLARQVRVFSLLQPLADLAAELDVFRPTLLATYPTAGEMLAQEKEAGRLHIAPAEIWTGGECLCSSVRERLSRVFGCRVRNGYGASEFLSIASECECGSLHVNADWVVLEPVDANYRVLDPGETSTTVLLTNLANGIQPLVRYDLGDSITVLPAPCGCGNGLPAIRVEGRHDDVLHGQAQDGHDVLLLPLVLATVLEEGAQVHDFQLVQSASDRVVLRIGRAEAGRAARACAVLREHFLAQGVRGLTLDLATEEPQPDRASGKLRRVIRVAGPPPGARDSVDRAQSSPWPPG